MTRPRRSQTNQLTPLRVRSRSISADKIVIVFSKRRTCRVHASISWFNVVIVNRWV
jgi:hypothetical protein